MNFDKIYFKPNIKRDEPEVIKVNSDAALSEETKYSYRESVDRLKNRIRYLSTSFDALNKDHYKIIDVYKKRAEMLKISLPIKELSKKDKNIESASKVLFGGIADSLPFDKYVELLIKEQNVASTVVSSHIVTESTPEEILEKASIQSNPYIQSIATIKNAYKDHLIKNELYDFLTIHFNINSLAKNGSAKAALGKTAADIDKKDEFANDAENRNSSGAPVENQEDNIIEKASNSLMDFLAECIPCGARYINILGNASFADEYDNFLSLFNNRLNVAIGELLLSKLHLLRFRFLGDICALMQHLMNFVCIPDLAAILSLLKMLMFKIQVAISGEWNFNLDIAGSLLTSILQSVVDALFEMLTQLALGALSAVTCVITDLEFQSQKLNTPAFDYSFTFEGSKTQSDIRNSFEGLRDSLFEGKAYVDGMIKSVEDTFSKILNFSKSSSLFELHGELNATLSLFSLVNEIFALVKSAQGLAPGEGALEAVCKAAYGGQSPWIKFLSNLPDDVRDSLSEYAEQRDRSPDEDVEDSQDEGSSPGRDDETDSDNTIGGDLLVIVDTTIDPTFFDDDPIDSILSDPYYDSIPELPSNLENGDPAVDFSDKLNKYNNIKNILTESYNVLSSSPESYSISSSFSPVGFIDFSSCISSSSIPASQINEWINKIKK